MANQMAYATADNSTPTSRSVQSKEVLDMGPITADQLRRAGCLEVVDRQLSAISVGSGMDLNLFENGILQLVQRSRLALDTMSLRCPQRKKSTCRYRTVERGSHSTSVFRLTGRSGYAPSAS